MQNSECVTFTAGTFASVSHFRAAYDRLQEIDDKSSEAAFEARRELERWTDIKRKFESFIESRGRRYAGVTFANYVASIEPQKQVVQRLVDYAERAYEAIAKGKNIVVFGPRGTGKDHLLVATAKAVFNQCTAIPKWFNGVDLQDRLRKQNLGEQCFWRDEYTAPDILYVSDPLPPTGTLSEFQQSAFFRVIDDRYSAMKPTWVTLNVADGEEAERRMGAQTVDRLRHDALILCCDWPSYREAKQ